MVPGPPKLKGFFLVLILVLALGISGCQKAEKTPTPGRKGVIPLLSPASFKKTVRDHKGRVLIVNFFATWCEPCRRELPDLVSVATAYKSKGVDFIGVSLDRGGAKVLRPFLEKIKIPYPVYLGDQALMISLKIQAIPTTFFYDREGNRAGTFTGLLSRQQLVERVEALLGAS